MTPRDRVVHELKTWPEPFRAVKSGEKRYEIRENDRGFAVGDLLRLREYNPKTFSYSGDETTVRVAYMTTGGQWGLPDTMCVMSLAALDATSPAPPPLTAGAATFTDAELDAWWLEGAKPHAHVKDNYTRETEMNAAGIAVVAAKAYERGVARCVAAMQEAACNERAAACRAQMVDDYGAKRAHNGAARALENLAVTLAAEVAADGGEVTNG